MKKRYAADLVAGATPVYLAADVRGLVERVKKALGEPTDQCNWVECKVRHDVLLLCDEVLRDE